MRSTKCYVNCKVHLIHELSWLRNVAHFSSPAKSLGEYSFKIFSVREKVTFKNAESLTKYIIKLKLISS